MNESDIYFFFSEKLHIQFSELSHFFLFHFQLADAYEEVEEQRQVVGQWKRKTQKMTNEMNDLRMLLEEQNIRNNLLEKKQRKFDLECQSLLVSSIPNSCDLPPPPFS